MKRRNRVPDAKPLSWDSRGGKMWTVSAAEISVLRVWQRRRASRSGFRRGFLF